MLNLAQLSTFVAVVDGKGFGAAAELLKCSQPTVSQHLRKLEEALGATLIQRDRSKCVPTRDGLRLLPLARRLLKGAERAEDIVKGKSIVVGASSNIGVYLLQPYVADGQRSGIPIKLQIASNPEIADRLTSGELDLAVMEWWDQRSGFSARLWRREKMVVIVHPKHRWAQKKKIQVEDLLSEPMIGGEAGTGTGTLLQKVLRKKASRMKVSMNLGSTEAVKAGVKAGLGISLVFEPAVTDEIRAGSLRAIDVVGLDIKKELFVILPEETPSEAAPHKFSDLLLGS